jgi:hypothetical protein
MSPVEIAVAASTFLAPFLPSLLEVGKQAGKKFGESLAAEGGKAALGKAQALWQKIKDKFADAPEIQGAATVVATNPEDESFQKLLAKTLGARLNENPEFAQELLGLLGGQEAAQKIIAERNSWVEDVTQEIEGSGTQTVEARDQSTIKGVKQSIKR